MSERRDFGSVRRLATGRFQARYVDGNGQTRTCSFDTKKQAGAYLAQVRADVTAGRWSDPSLARQLLREYALVWLDTRVALKPTTRQNYSGVLSRHVLPPLGRTPLQELTAVRVRAWYAELARTASPTPTRQAYALLRTILNSAVDDELLLRNPCRITGAGASHSAERPIATLAQVDALADAVYPRYRALVLLAAWTGARWGELIALTRDRLDLASGQMRIDRQYVLLKAEGDLPTRIVLQSPKTAAGRRTVHVPPHLLPVLAAHLLEHVPPGCELVFPNRQGGPVHRGSFTSVWHRARDRAGLPGFHFHDLRHTGNTLAATTGASTRELMARMGHASMRAAVLYQHATSERDAQVAAALSELAQRQRAPKASVVRLFAVGGEAPDRAQLAAGS